MPFTYHSTRYRLLVFLLFVVISLLSGYIGGMIAQEPFNFETAQFRQLTIERPVTKKSDGSIESLFKKTQPLIVTLVAGSEKQRVSHSMVYASGVILTSDGWIAAPRIEHVSTDMLYGIRWDGSSAKIIKKVSDPSFEIDYYKMEGSSMGAVDFLPKEQSFEARYAFVVLPQKIIDRILTIRRWYPFTQKDGIQRYSDLLEKAYLTSANTYPSGSPVFTEDAQLLGIMNNSNIIPSFYIQDGLKRLLRYGRIQRVSLKLSYIDLTSTPALLQKPQIGAMIVADRNGVPMKTKGGKIMLNNGDIIAKVNAEEINENQSLSELLLQYSINDEISLTVIRADGKEHTLTVLSQ